MILKSYCFESYDSFIRIPLQGTAIRRKIAVKSKMFWWSFKEIAAISHMAFIYMCLPPICIINLLIVPPKTCTTTSHQDISNFIQVIVSVNMRAAEVREVGKSLDSFWSNWHHMPKFLQYLPFYFICSQRLGEKPIIRRVEKKNKKLYDVMITNIFVLPFTHLIGV